MQRRDLLGIGGVGGCVDTVGSSKRKRRGRPSESSGEEEESALTFSLSRSPQDKLKDEVEERLEEIVFGKKPFHPVQHKIAAGSSDSEAETEEESADEGTSSGRLKGLKKQPAWHDEDDDKIRVDISARARTKKLRKTAEETTVSGTLYHKRLRSQYKKLLGQPEWAIRSPKSKKKCKTDTDTSDDDDDDDDDDIEEESILQRTGHLLKTSSEQLSSRILELKRMTDANAAKRAQAVVRAVEFHPSADVILVAGYHKTLDLFQVDGENNPKLQSVHVQGFPISTAHFTQDGKEVVMAGRRKRFFVYDMIAGKVVPVYGIRGRDERYFDRFVVSPDNQYLVFLGKNGYILLVSNMTKQWIGEMKMNGNVFDVSFTSDSRFMLSFGSEGKVYVWDMSTRDCIHCFVDEGCILGTRVALSPNSKYLACGSDSGVVNLYSAQNCLTADGPFRPKPLKSLMNLTTGTDALCMNPTSELMVMASQRKKDTLKVVHLPSQTVFCNWPVRRTPLGYVTAVDISPHSKYLAIGNAKGRVLLYRFNHYSQ